MFKLSNETSKKIIIKFDEMSDEFKTKLGNNIREVGGIEDFYEFDNVFISVDYDSDTNITNVTLELEDYWYYIYIFGDEGDLSLNMNELEARIHMELIKVLELEEK